MISKIIRTRYPLAIAAVTIAFSIAAPFAFATSIGTNVSVSGTLTVPAAYSLDTASAGTLNIGTTTATAIEIGSSSITTTIAGLTVMTSASTTHLSIGGSTGTTLNNVQAGSCTLVSVTISATSTAYTICTGAGTVDNTYKVVLQPMSTLPAGLVVDSASTTATAGTISVRINNVNAGQATAAGTPTLNFWAFK